jgi:hypothetical protein
VEKKYVGSIVQTVVVGTWSQNIVNDVYLNYFRTENLLEKHKGLCINVNKYCVTLLKETEKYLSFKNHRYQEKVPFVIYADLESILEKVVEKNMSYETISTPYQKHTAYLQRVA